MKVVIESTTGEIVLIDLAEETTHPLAHSCFSERDEVSHAEVTDTGAFFSAAKNQFLRVIVSSHEEASCPPHIVHPQRPRRTFETRSGPPAHWSARALCLDRTRGL